MCVCLSLKSVCVIGAWATGEKNLLIALCYQCVYAFMPVRDLLSCVQPHGAFACIFEFYFGPKSVWGGGPPGPPLSALIGMLIMSLWVGYECVFVKDP